MVKILENVEDWTLGLITDLVTEGYNESEILELKKDLDFENQRIGRTVCAFSNTLGGTIVFGVDNDKTKSQRSTYHIIINNKRQT